MCKPQVSRQPFHNNYQDTGSLKNAASFPIGASINVRLLRSDSLYRKTILENFNSVTAENAMKWEATEPIQDNYNMSDADDLVNFALKNNLRIHGHNLAWYQGNPQWLENFKGERSDWQQLLRRHIQTIMNRYKGKINSWDVINEAFDGDGKYRINNIWGKHLGNEYIVEAFRIAHETDPKALLFYNDYGMEESSSKSDAILKLIDQLKRSKIPINGVGLQMHINIHTPDQAISSTIKKFAATGLLIHISELDIRINEKENKLLSLNKSLDDQQAEKYHFLVSAYKTLVPYKQQFGITTWDVGDKDSWIRRLYCTNDWPLLFDDNYSKKQSYFSFLHALKSDQPL